MVIGRRARRSLALIGLFLLIALPAVPAGAHGTLDRSEPPNGGMIAVGRSTLTLWFSEPISEAASTFDLHTVDGVRAGLTVSTVQTDGGALVEIATGPLLKATYVLDWAVLSLDDGHPSQGSVLFGVGVRPTVTDGGRDALPPALGLAIRWLDLTGIIVALGVAAVSGRVIASAGTLGRSLRQRAYQIGMLAAGGSLLTGAVTPFLRVPRGGSSLRSWFDTTWATLTGTFWGRLWTAREIGLMIIALALFARLNRSEVSSNRFSILGVAAAGVIGIEAWAGHASGLARQTGMAVLADGLHLAAAGVWGGGLVVLALLLLPVVRGDADTRGPLLASVWRTFSPMAAIAALVLVATGVYESGRHLPDLQSAGSTVYGQGVVFKIAVLVVALFLAGLNTLLVHPNLAERVGRVVGRPLGWAPVSLKRFTTVVATEAVLLIVAIAGAALVTSVPTTREVVTAATETGPTSANVDGLFVTFEAVPAGPDQSRLIVRARSTAKPELGPMVGVEVVLVDPRGTTTEGPLVEIEPGRYEVESDRLTSGVWDVSVVMSRGGTADATMTSEWVVPDPTTQAARPLERAATSLAVLLLVAGAGTYTFNYHRREVPAVDRPLVLGRQR